MLEESSRAVLSYACNRNRFVKIDWEDLNGCIPVDCIEDATFFTDVFLAKIFAENFPGKFVMEVVSIKILRDQSIAL